MARVQNTLIGHASGSIGNATFSTWKGINVLKEKAASVSNPNTILQQMQRSALAQVVVIYRAISAVAFLGFKKLAIKQSAWNAFASNSLKNSFDFIAPPLATLVPVDILISKGTMTTTQMMSAAASQGNGAIIITFDGSLLLPGQAFSDTVLAAVLNTATNEWAISGLLTVRNNNEIEVVMPSNWAAGDNIVSYLGFYSNIDGNSSDSVANQGVIVA